MTAITRNLPSSLKNLGISVIGTVTSNINPMSFLCFLTMCLQECYTSLIENLDITDVKCLKYSLSKGLGIGVVVGGSIVKVPQILLSEISLLFNLLVMRY